MATEDVAAWFSGFSVLISVIAAVRAHESWKAAERSASSAERANDITMHQSRLEIYKVFQSFHGMLVQRGPYFDEAVVWPFFTKANLSEFYFNENLYSRLTALAQAALDLVSKAEEFERLRQEPEGVDRPTLTNLLAVLNTEHRKLRTECSSLDEAMRKELRLLKHGD